MGTGNGLASHPRGVEIFLVALNYATETGISPGLMGHLACMQTLPYLLLLNDLSLVLY